MEYKYSQEGKGDVAVDLGLDGDLNLEVKVETELQSSWGSSLALRATDNLSAEDRGGLSRCEFSSGFWGRHCVGRIYWPVKALLYASGDFVGEKSFGVQSPRGM